MPHEVKLTDGLLKRYAPAAVFKESAAPVNSCTFSDDGRILLTASDDEFVRIYSAETGAAVGAPLPSRKYGVSLLRASHHGKAVLCAGGARSAEMEKAGVVRYWSLADNRFLAYFVGHEGPVSALEMSPKNDSFLSCGQVRERETMARRRRC